MIVWTVDEQCGGDHSVPCRRSQHVPGNLLPHKLIVGLVLVEAANDVITIGPGMRPRRILFESFAFTETDDVVPVLRPALPVVWATRGLWPCF